MQSVGGHTFSAYRGFRAQLRSPRIFYVFAELYCGFRHWRLISDTIDHVTYDAISGALFVYITIIEIVEVLIERVYVLA